jgi:hypothetical protein
VSTIREERAFRFVAGALLLVCIAAPVVMAI